MTLQQTILAQLLERGYAEITVRRGNAKTMNNAIKRKREKIRQYAIRNACRWRVNLIAPDTLRVSVKK